MIGLKAAGVAVIRLEQQVEAVFGLIGRLAFLDYCHMAETVPCADLFSGADQFKKNVGV